MQTCMKTQMHQNTTANTAVSTAKASSDCVNENHPTTLRFET